VQEVPPATTVRKNGSEEISKSGPLTVTITLANFEIIPLVPVTSTKYSPAFVPGGAVTESVAVFAGGSVTTGWSIPALRPGG
jgi:hypothetical protein